MKQLHQDIGESKDNNQVKSESKPVGKTISFWLNDDENEKASKFVKQHEMCGSKAAIGGALTYEFSPTSIGCVIKIKCHCGNEVDVTDYNSW
jgi:cystathionine beta-lyase/cystathionine gamma-synthase